jgi:hypothetical protein
MPAASTIRKTTLSKKSQIYLTMTKIQRAAKMKKKKTMVRSKENVEGKMLTINILNFLDFVQPRRSVRERAPTPIPEFSLNDDEEDQDEDGNDDIGSSIGSEDLIEIVEPEDRVVEESSSRDSSPEVQIVDDLQDDREYDLGDLYPELMDSLPPFAKRAKLSDIFQAAIVAAATSPQDSAQTQPQAQHVHEVERHDTHFFNVKDEPENLLLLAQSQARAAAAKIVRERQIENFTQCVEQEKQQPQPQPQPQAQPQPEVERQGAQLSNVVQLPIVEPEPEDLDLTAQAKVYDPAGTRKRERQAEEFEQYFQREERQKKNEPVARRHRAVEAMEFTLHLDDPEKEWTVSIGDNRRIVSIRCNPPPHFIKELAWPKSLSQASRVAMLLSEYFTQAPERDFLSVKDQWSLFRALVHAWANQTGSGRFRHLPERCQPNAEFASVVSCGTCTGSRKAPAAIQLKFYYKRWTVENIYHQHQHQHAALTAAATGEQEQHQCQSFDTDVPWPATEDNSANIVTVDTVLKGANFTNAADQVLEAVHKWSNRCGYKYKVQKSNRITDGAKYLKLICAEKSNGSKCQATFSIRASASSDVKCLWFGGLHSHSPSGKQ